jgi:hypothetical protein
MPPTKPMIGAAHISTKPAGAVIATRPAIAPLPTMPTSSFLVSSQIRSAAPMTPPTAPMFVTAMTSPNAASVVPNVEPPLKPNQPSQRIRTPRPNSGMLWPGIARGLPSGPYLPLRGPSSRRQASAAVAPVRWTTEEPAKSCTPEPTLESRPPPHAMWAISG